MMKSYAASLFFMDTISTLCNVKKKENWKNPFIWHVACDTEWTTTALVTVRISKWGKLWRSQILLHNIIKENYTLYTITFYDKYSHCTHISTQANQNNWMNPFDRKHRNGLEFSVSSKCQTLFSVLFLIFLSSECSAVNRYWTLTHLKYWTFVQWWSFHFFFMPLHFAICVYRIFICFCMFMQINAFQNVFDIILLDVRWLIS